MNPILRCKLRVNNVTQNKAPNGDVETESVTLRAVYSDDKTNPNYDWSRWTPAADFTMHISNPSAFGKLPQGHEFFVDFTPAT